MGQQQLLLLVLGVVIVGLAVVVGIEAFDSNRTRAAQDELVNAGVRIAGEGTAWTLHAKMLGGGGGSPAGITFAGLGYEVQADGSYASGDGVYTLTSDASGFVTQGVAADFDVYVTTAVYGPEARCVLTETATGAAPLTPAAPAGCSW